MAYPSKINRVEIVEAALALLEREGEEALTLRRLAAEIGVTANALYRYFGSRDVLIAAVADAVARRLCEAIDLGLAELGEVDPPTELRIRRLLTVYAAFAAANPDLYRVLLGADPVAVAELPEPRHHELLWDRSLSVVQPLVGARDAPAATVALWGLLHGIWGLRQAGVLGGRKPAEIDDFAFDVVIRGLRS